MNTIPSIFNQRQVNRTILGGKEPMPFVKMNVSVVLLNGNGSQLRIPMIENLVKCGFESIISIENNKENYNIIDFSQKFPFVKFIVPLEKVTDGELINIGISESKSDYVLVIRDTISLDLEILTGRIAEKLEELDIFCIVPRLKSHTIPAFPVSFSPIVEKSVFNVVSTSSVSDGQPTLYPFDKIGFYNKKKFIQLGGFDYTITTPYWQNLDLAFRAWLWGERICLSTIFTLTYTDELPRDDLSINKSYNRFYMKNLLPRFNEDHGFIPKTSFFVYLLRSNYGIFESISQFSMAREWVSKNKYRFKYDAKYLIENWGNL